MQAKDSWLLPDGIEEILPEEAKHLENLRTQLLDLFACWGYELVIPPFIDFLDSLLTGAGHDLDLQTFKLTDQISGEMLGIRADMTPQVARIDAHNLKHAWPTRLCYVGTILHTRGDPLEKTRSPMQIGAELYGHAGKESDIEVIRLMLEMLAITGLQNVHLDLGHVGIYRALAKQAQLSSAQESELFAVLQRKACPELTELMDSYAIANELKTLFLNLPKLNGDREILNKARTIFAHANEEVQHALADLVAIADKLAARFPSLPISFDLAELRGYHYHTGMVFAAFVPSIGREIARGGRYDNIGAVFGRARPATGFSADLKLLATLSKTTCIKPLRPLIFAPYLDDAALTEKIRALRADQQAVVQQLPDQTGTAQDLGCTAVLEFVNQQWVIRPL
ncbi:MAG: ATP phosphoribosyltransferase regulatory subunit [Methylococcaceae bacterium]|nr:ATP phosphoribosyltransferase regulatory subunit [Methylococcaceae bacterium]MDD1608371.1 ATP phosphoribosyltransferase regulatory subunit [Methylococcaceae bacterium]MDD1610296.1 ATP phosphoribosyltransferase regulatory subunit [Methylococcaceae bacterium]MDD1616936.1 ATP phosphoribosyltransferase regulatory subunit [Methylococcaceae bacterium]OYV16444.1 MAG: ATP phosphoribosyltransferase regulatory subunit [Methylococcaceae bacterium NSP1-2]